MSLAVYQATYLVLKKWLGNPNLTKREIGIWDQWSENNPDNNKPLSTGEVNKLKETLRRNNPSSYNQLFPQNC